MKNKDLHLLAFYTRVPKDPKKTFMKDFGKSEDNWSYNEQVHFTRGLRGKDLEKAGVILNVSEQKVIKCSFNKELHFISLFNYFRKNYPQYMQILDMGIQEKEIMKIAQTAEEVQPTEETNEQKVDAPANGE